MNAIEIRDISRNDYDDIIRINESVVEHMNPINEERLEMLLGYSAYSKLAIIEGAIVGFVLAMRENQLYNNDNYRWFSDRYDTFLYIDRVAIYPGFEGKGIG